MRVGSPETPGLQSIEDVDGCDPFAQRHPVVGLSCRLYRTAAGTSGSPSIEQLAAVLG